jgi:RNA polymerase sigma factor (sigma-70 family)
VARHDESFAASFRELYTSALLLARRLTNDPYAAEDLAAEAMARAYAHWGKVHNAESPRAWVLRVTTNLAVDQARRHHSQLRFAPMLVDRDATTEDNELAVTRLALVAALAALPQRQREAVALRYLADLEETEISRALGISASTVRTHVQRGLAGLRDALGPAEVQRVALT